MTLREWIARKLLTLAWRVDRESSVVYDAQRGYMFRRNWVQPTLNDGFRSKAGQNAAQQERVRADVSSQGHAPAVAAPEDEGSPYSAWMKTAPPEER